MPAPVDLYNTSYGNYESDIYCRVRAATYGEDFGQTSWVSNEESREIPRMLRLKRASCVLEIGCGSGRYALQIAETVGCKVVGVDVNEAGVRNATRLAQARGVAERVSFERCDVSRQLPFADSSFDDTTENAAAIAERWRAAREERKQELIALEGANNFAGVQEFLACVHVLTREKRLLRYLYTAQKPN